MRIRRIKLGGFKSFVDPVELRVEPGLTGVVGPNGCGKSNLLEAIRWAMGEGSPKSLRGGGMDDVIFAGTTQRPARDFAEVSILVDGAGGIDPQVEVTRRIERGAGSAYRINGRDVRARDVALLFADAATGAHSPAMIGQGRIGAVIAARPAERRAMLEEAAGIAGLHVRRKDAEARLRATEANLARVGETLGQMAARAHTLRRQARAAERYRALSDAIRIAEARLLFARWRDADAAAQAAVAAADAAAQAATAAEAQRADAAAAQSAAAVDAVAARARTRGARDALGEATQRLAAAETRRADIVRRRQQASAQRDALDDDRRREAALDGDAVHALAHLAAEDEATRRRVADAQSARPAAVRASAGADDAVAPAERVLAAALAAEAGEQAEARIAQAQLAGARERLARARAAAARVARDDTALGDDAPWRSAREDAATIRARADAEGIAAADAATRSEARRTAASDARDTLERAAAEASAVLAALESEARALVRALEGHGRDRVRAARPASGYERALAAALGEDLEAAVGGDGTRRWAGAAICAQDPALPPGVIALARHVDAPPALTRRLAQVGVVDLDDGSIALAVGQRLVTRDGRLRRWDGFVAAGEGAAAAERMIRVNRLAVIERELAPARSAAEAARARVADMLAELTAARTAAEAARREVLRCEAASRDAGRREASAAAQIERIETLRGGLAEQAARAIEEVGLAEAAVAAAERVIAALPEPRFAIAASAAARHAAGESRTAAALSRAAVEAIDRGCADATARLAVIAAEAEGWARRRGEADRRITAIDARIAELDEEAATLAHAPATLDEDVAVAAGARDAVVAAAREADLAEAAAETALAAAEGRLAVAVEGVAAARELRAGAAERRDHATARRVELGRVAGERFDCPAPLLPGRAGFDAAGIGAAAAESAAHDALIVDRERIGPVNLVAERELAEIEGEQAGAAAERDELAEAVAQLRGAVATLDGESRARLRAAFEAVDRHFRRLFTGLFGGGEAHLALVDAEDPLEAGLEIMAQPPGKRLGQLSLLSGGEQTLTAVALVFALFLTNPAPICVLDEVDAPLDDANVERFCDLLDRMAAETDTRFLIVTHNALTMSRMHRLYGVTMIERGVSRLVSVNLGGAEELLAAE